MVWQLAIETSGREGSLALLDDDQTVREVNLPDDQQTAASFAPALRDLLSRIPAEDTLGLVSVVDGPGSFTGLRIGVTTAKTLAFATNCKLVSVDSLQVICEMERQRILANQDHATTNNIQIGVATNAYRKQVFMRTEWLHSEDDHPDPQTKIVDGVAWDSWSAQQKVLAIGRDLSPADLVQPRTSDGWPRPMAAYVGRIGWKMYQSGKTGDYWTLVPRYLRKSAAEEKADAEKGSAKQAD